MMAKKAKRDDPKEQLARFQRAVQDIRDAGGLSPDETDDEMERTMGKVATSKPSSLDT